MRRTQKRHEPGDYFSHVKKGDEVLVLAGRSAEARGRVVTVDPQKERAIVEGVNLVTKHQKSQSMRPDAQQQSGRIERPAPIHVSNLMVICPNCNTPTRAAHKEINGEKTRVCKRCGEGLEREQGR